MKFKKGKSGNPKGRPKGSVNYCLALKNLLEESFKENEEVAKQMIVDMFKDPRSFRRLCELKAQFELKELPNKLQGTGDDGEFLVKVVIDDGNKAPQESGNRISKYLTV